jgi:ABC-type oligopeptide transport system ATPase subunit
MDSLQESTLFSDLVEVRGISKHYTGRDFSLTAVDDITFTIRQGEILGLVGESGSGKTTLGKILLRLVAPTSGEIFFKGQSLTSLTPSQFKPYRRKMQMVFQHPYGSLNPQMTVQQTISEALFLHGLNTPVEEVLGWVGLDRTALQKYPHQFSGGQKQRIAIARALAVDPEFIVFDEPLSSLDVSVQAQIVTMLQNLQKQKKLTYLFITHDLNMTRHLCDRVVVMSQGKIVEVSSDIFSNPKHPYTQKLIDSIPSGYPD